MQTLVRSDLLLESVITPEVRLEATDYTLVVDPRGDQLAAARACEADVFLETYGNTEAQWAEEYGPYDDVSTFIAVLDDRGDAVGVVRLIMPSERPVKSLADLSRSPWGVDGTRSARAAGIDPALAWDVSTLAVRRKQGRGGLISAALYHGMLHTMRANRAGWLIMIMDARARRLLHGVGLRTDVLPGTRPAEYLGSPDSTPVWAEISRMVDGQRTANPDAHRLIVQGVGLDSVTLPSDFVVGRARPVAALRGV